MTYGSQIAIRTRFPFDALSAQQRKATRRKLARLRKIRRVVHFLGFLAFWAVTISVTYLLTLAVLIVAVLLA